VAWLEEIMWELKAKSYFVCWTSFHAIGLSLYGHYPPLRLFTLSLFVHVFKTGGRAAHCYGATLKHRIIRPSADYIGEQTT